MHVAVAFQAILLALLAGGVSRAQVAPARGTISGTVTADNGAVRGFRVTAHNLQYRIWYTVYTKDAHYVIPQALPGTYDIGVVEQSYDSPAQKAELPSGQSITADVAITRRNPPTEVSFVEYDQLYPPGMGRDLLEQNCMGCHNRIFFHLQHRDEASWRAAIRKMQWGPSVFLVQPPLGRTQLSATNVDTMARYLASNFGPQSPKRDLRLDAVPVDEAALSKAIFVQYDISEDAPGLPKGVHLDDAFIAANRSVWFSVVSGSAILRLQAGELDPAKRWKVFATAGAMAAPHGIAEGGNGHMYFAELVGTKLGEIDPATGKVSEHETPSRGGMHSLLRDAQNNIWYSEYLGSTIGMLDAKSGLMSSWATPTTDAGPYGLVQDKSGNIWTAGSVKHLLLKFDPAAEVFTEFKTPTAFSGPRRLRLDSTGTIWFTETQAGQIGSINPATGMFKEYKLPLRNSSPDELWFDPKDDNLLWTADQINGHFVRMDRRSNQFTYYPLPQLNWDVAKAEVEQNGTVWFATHPVAGRKLAVQGGVHFYPEGYSVNAPPQP